MSLSWDAFVSGSIAGQPDDPFVRLLRERIAGGYQIVRMNFIPRAKEVLPEYLVILEHEKQLSEMRIPHSQTFTRFTMENGIRMETEGEEACRHSVMLQERFTPLVGDVENDFFESALLARLKELEPPRTMQKISNTSRGRYGSGPAWERTIRDIDSVLAGLLHGLGRSLHYEENAAGDIVDRAVEIFIDDRLHISFRKELFGK